MGGLFGKDLLKRVAGNDSDSESEVFLERWDGLREVSKSDRTTPSSLEDSPALFPI